MICKQKIMTIKIAKILATSAWFLMTATTIVSCEKKSTEEVKSPAEFSPASEGGFEAPGSVDTAHEASTPSFFEEVEKSSTTIEDVDSKARKLGEKYTVEGINFVKNSDYSRAKEKFETALEVDPRQYISAYNLGVIAEKEGKTDRAKKYYIQSFKAKPDYGPAVCAYTKLQYKLTGAKTVALSYIEPIALKYQNSVEIQNCYGHFLIEKGRYEKAIEVAKSALKIDETNVGSMIVLARGYLGKGQEEFSRFILDQAKEIDSDNPEIYYVYALINLKNEKTKTAIANLKKVVELDPNFVEAQNNLGVLLLKGANFEEAANHLQKAASLAPSRGEIFLNLGEAYRGMKKWEDAIESFEKAERLGAPKSMVYFDLALLYFSADGIKGMSKKDILVKARDYFIKYRNEVGATMASREIDVEFYLKRIDKMIKIQERLEAKRKKQQMRLEQKHQEGQE